MPPSHTIEPEAILFADDGFVPNNPRLPFVIYRGAIDLIGLVDPEDAIEKRVSRNGWGEFWRNGIYPYVHYHSMIHEGMGIARGRRRVRFGGNKGREIELTAGRRRGAAGRHRAPVPVAQPRPDGDRRLSPDRPLRPLPRQQGRPRPRRCCRSRRCRCPIPTRCSASRARCCGCGTTELAKLHVSVRLDRVLGRRASDLRGCAP